MKGEALSFRRRVCFKLISRKLLIFRTKRYINQCMTIAFDYDIEKLRRKDFLEWIGMSKVNTEVRDDEL